MLDNHQILTSEIDFADIWSQTQRVSKSRLLGLILSTSGAKATKSSVLVLILPTSGAQANKSLNQDKKNQQIETSGIDVVNARKSSNLLGT